MKPKRIVTHSELTTFDTCKRKHRLAYGLALRPIQTATPLRMGSAIHACLDAVRKTPGRLKDDILPAIAATLKAYDDAGCDPSRACEWQMERAKVYAMLAGYYWRWGGHCIDALESEFQFNLPIRNPRTNRPSALYRKAGKIDGIVRVPDGRVALLEVKTTSDSLDPDSPLWRRLRIDAQISTYLIAVREAGHDVATIMYDMLGKPQLKPLQATPPEKRKYKKDTGELYANQRENDETPDEYRDRCLTDIYAYPDKYYARREIPRTATDLEEAATDLWQKVQWLHHCGKSRCWPRNDSACLQWGRCTYFELCTTGYDINSGDVPDGFERVDNVHQELNMENANGN